MAFSVDEDQTDADFFDNLVSDDDDIVISTAANKLTSNLSSLSIKDVEDSEVANVSSKGVAVDTTEVSEVNVKEIDSAPNHDSNVQRGVQVNGDEVPETSQTGSSVDERKASSSIKTAQWSSFGVDTPSGLDGSGLYVDFLNQDSMEVGNDFDDGFFQETTEPLGRHGISGDGSYLSDLQGSQVGGTSKSGTHINDGRSSFVASTFQATHYDGAAPADILPSSTDVVSSSNENDPKYWEQLYPGWKYDESTQQWYMIDNFDSSVIASAYSTNITNDMSGSFYQKHVQLDSYQQPATNSQDNTLSNKASNWDQVSQSSQMYPQNMVFDPQYPGWYYDTNTAQWFTLESYTQSTLAASFTSQSAGLQDLSMSGHFAEMPGEEITNHQFSENKNSNVFPENWGSQGNQSFSNTNGDSAGVGFVLKDSHSLAQQQHVSPSPQLPLSSNYYSTQNSFGTQHHHSASTSFSSFAYQPYGAKSPAGPPAHAVVAFGFGGKLLVMRNVSSFAASFDNGKQDSGGSASAVLVFNLAEVVLGKLDSYGAINSNVGSYFHSLCRQPTPGPLGGNLSTKDVTKWLDEKIASFEPFADYQTGYHQKLVCSLLKILCQHFGKLRSSFGSELTQENYEGPDLAVTKLFSSAKRSSAQMWQSNSRCLQNLPSEDQQQAMALEVQNLLVAGKRHEALQCAQEGQLWGPALLLAFRLGEMYYIDTVKRMAQNHFAHGSPLRTLCLLIAGQPREVLPLQDMSNGSPIAMLQPTQVTAGSILDDWEENLAIMSANRTKNDELVITHLGDCLWKERGEVMSAHACYLVAEWSIDAYSQSARMCLIGADHWKNPRTFASPQAIQMTEVYEYAKVSGNAQYILPPFQPFKLIYAHMLAEMGKLNEALKYCQASLKLLKSSAHAPELELLKHYFSSLEDQIRAHQQGGFRTSPVKMVGKLFGQLDRSLHRMVGAPPSPLPPMHPSSLNDTNTKSSYSTQANIVSSQPVMTRSVLVPSSQSVEASPLPPMHPSSLNHANTKSSYSTQANIVSSQPVMTRSVLVPSSQSVETLPLPPMHPSSLNHANTKSSYSTQANIVSSQPVMTSSVLVPSSSQSVGTVSEQVRDETTKSLHNPSVPAPPVKGGDQNGEQPKAAPSSGGPRFSLFGSVMQKTFGLLSRPRHEAKLGEANKFRYDEKLKRWVEEGAEIPSDEAALPPPPPTAALFQNGGSDYNLKSNPSSIMDTMKEGIADGSMDANWSSRVDQDPVMPPIPASQNPFSSQNRGTRGRYVDTFNKGGRAPARSFQPSAAPAVNPMAGAKFFIPTMPVNVPEEKTDEHSAGTSPETAAVLDEPPSLSAWPNTSPGSPPVHAPTAQPKYASMDDLNSHKNGSPEPLVRSRSSLEQNGAASWNGAEAAAQPVSSNFRAASPLPLPSHGSRRPRSSSPPLHYSQSSSNSAAADDLLDIQL